MKNKECFICSVCQHFSFLAEGGLRLMTSPFSNPVYGPETNRCLSAGGLVQK